MTLFEFGLVLGGSVIHLGWNVLAKNRPRQHLFLAWALFFAGVVPGIVNQCRTPSPIISTTVLFWTTGSAIFHVIYFSLLAKAYNLKSDLSFVYPFSRGIGALASTLVAMLALGDVIHGWARLGIPLILLGTFLEPYFIWIKNHKIKAIGRDQFMFSLLVGISIAAYLLWDKVALHFISSTQLLAPMLFMTSIFLIGIETIHSSVKISVKELPRAIIGGAFIFGSYHLIMWAMETAPLSYVTAARSSGVIFSAFSGRIIFKEQLSFTRWVGIATVTLGLILLAF